MKAKLTAGAELDLLNRDELAETLKSWGHELTRGARFRRRSMAGTVAADGSLTIGTGSDDTFGPAEGFVWAVTRISIAGIDPDTQWVNAYANDANPSSLLVPRISRVEYPGDHAVVLVSGDQLVIAGSTLTATAIVTATVQIKEAPTLMAWSL